MRYLLVLVLLLVGCTPTATPSSSPSAPSSATPEPSPTCSPLGSTPYPCSAGEYQEVEVQNQLSKDAQAVYGAYWKENVRLQKAGGVTSPTPALKRVLMQPALGQSMKVYRNLKSNKARAVGGTWKVLRMTPQPTRSVEGSLTTLEVCWRAKDVVFKAPGRTVSGTATVVEANYFRLQDGDLRVFHRTSREVKAC